MSVFIDIIKGKCPNCKKEKVFNANGNLLILKLPKMHEKCPNCKYKFEREPGYFIGAMYVSYALTIAEMVAFFIFFNLILGIDFTMFIYISITCLLLLSMFNFRLSRLIWMYMI